MDEAGIVDGGKQLSKAEASGKKRSYLRVANVMEAFIRTDNVQEMAFSDSEFERFRLHSGDILLNEGQSLELVGRPAMYKGSPADCAFQNSLIRFRPHPHTDGRFALLLFRYFMRRGTFSAIASKTTSIAHLGVSRFAALSWTFPPLPEQRMIADILGTWDGALEKLDALIAGKQQAKLGLMQQLLSGRRRLPGFKGKWVKSRLGLVAENVSRRNSGDLGWDRLYAVTKASGMIPMRAHVMGLTTDRCKRVENGSFAYNPMRLNIGSIARWSGEEPVMVSPDYVVFRCKEGALSPRYFEHLRQADRWTQFVAGRGNGSVRVRLYFRDIASFELLKPPFSEQEAIADVLDTCDEELRLLGERRKALDLQKQGLMERLLTGALRVCP